MEAKLKNYYEDENCFDEAEEKLGNDFLKFRHIRVFMSDGHWNKINRNMNSWEELRKIILNLFDGKGYPRKIYYTPARWLNPEDLGSKERVNGGYKLRDNYLLNQNQVIFDLDTLDKEQLEKLRNYIRFSKYFDDIVYLIFSGGKGYHICANRKTDLFPIDDPLELEEIYEQINSTIGKNAKDYVGVGKLDVSALKDVRHIFKIPQTLSDNGDGIGICKFLDFNDLSSWEIDENFTLNSVNPKGDEESPPKHNGQGAKKTECGPCPSPSHYVGIRSSINGTNGCHVLFYHSEQYSTNSYREDLEKFKNICKKLRDEHSLSDIHILDNGEQFVAICFKKLDYEKLEKILGDVPESGNILWTTDEMKFVSKVDGFPTRHRSKSHTKFFGLKAGKVGNGKLSICRARPEEEKE